MYILRFTKSAAYFVLSKTEWMQDYILVYLGFPLGLPPLSIHLPMETSKFNNLVIAFNAKKLEYKYSLIFNITIYLLLKITK